MRKSATRSREASLSFPCSSVELGNASLPVIPFGFHIDRTQLINILLVGAIVDWLLQIVITAAMLGVPVIELRRRVARQYRSIEIHCLLTIERAFSFLRCQPKRN